MIEEGDATVLDEAARASWLYYVGRMTQDQIAREMGVSRQRAQRLVSRAIAEGLIHVRLEHKLASCLALEAELIRRFDLGHVRVAPDLGAGADPSQATAAAAAALLESFLARPDPLVIAFGTGRSLNSMAWELSAAPTERHRIVSLIGNIAPDGSASFFGVIMRIADKLHAPHYPMPVPVVSATPEERDLFHALGPVKAAVKLAREADVTFVGIGQMGDDAPIYKDGFISLDQLRDVQAKGATGEIVGWIYDSAGRYVDSPLTNCSGGVRIEPGRPAPVIGVAAGQTKLAAIKAALIGRIINGLVTDETTARGLLSAV